MAAGPKNAYAAKVAEEADRGREQGYEPKEVDMGRCECPGRPHDHDVAHVRDRFHWAQARRVIAAAQRDEMGEAEIVLIMQGLLSWNLTTRQDGEDVPLPILRETVDRLSPMQGLALKTALDEPHYLFGQTLSKDPGVPSPDGSEESTPASTS